MYSLNKFENADYKNKCIVHTDTDLCYHHAEVVRNMNIDGV